MDWTKERPVIVQFLTVTYYQCWSNAFEKTVTKQSPFFSQNGNKCMSYVSAIIKWQYHVRNGLTSDFISKKREDKLCKVET